MCPLAIYKLYLEKLNTKRDYLWQKPIAKVTGLEHAWYKNAVIRHDPLNNIMKVISEDACLSQIYTNHSIRSKCLTHLDEAGFEINHIQAISGHKSEESIKAYAQKCPDSKKPQMSEALDIMPVKNTPDPNKIVDFVSIENSVNDFDWDEIIREISQQIEEENQQKCEKKVK